MTHLPDVSRRQALLGLMATVSAFSLAGCESPEPAARSTPTPSESPPPATTATPEPTSAADVLPQTKPWVAHPAEITPAAKLRATRLVEIACAWEPGESGLAAARRRLADRGYDPALAQGLSPLLSDGLAATVEVVNAQYGGILPTTASVLMVVNQWVLGADERVKAGGTSLDVRLALRNTDGRSVWTVTDVRPARPWRPVADVSSVARKVLGDDRIGLPYAARLDIESGGISDSVLRAMRALASDFRYDVSVIQSGHPIRVFGTDRRSNHTDGNAVDVWGIEGRPVIKGGSTVTQLMAAAADVGPYQIGGPVNLDGSGGTLYFSDATHQDHIHLGFNA